MILATKRGAAPIQWLELDPRTYRALLVRSGVRDLFVGTNLPTSVELIRRQHLVTNPVFIDALATALQRPERD